MNLSPLRTLAASWRSEAELLRRRGIGDLAHMVESYALELDEALEGLENEALTLGEAAEESGYSKDHLARLAREGKIPNAGRPGAPRIRRANLPTKTGTLLSRSTPAHLAPTKTQIVRSVATLKGGNDG